MAAAVCAARQIKQLTLLILQSTAHGVLLGMKKRGFGAGKFNGFGGKIDPGESIREAALREMEEESGVKPLDATLHGNIVFEFEGHPELLEVHVFRATRFEGEPRESEEMAPRWFPEAAIPYETMWLDDAHWLPLLLRGGFIKARFLFRGHDTIVEKAVEELSGPEGLPRRDDARLVDKLQGPITA